MPSRAGHLLLGREPQLAERGQGPGAAAEHRDEDARLAGAQALDVTTELVDPHRHLEAERRRHRVLPVRAAREQRVLSAFRQAGEMRQHGPELAQEDLVGPAHLEKLAGLRDVLRGGAPVHVAAGVAVAGAVERPDQRHQWVAGLREPGAHGGQIEVLQLRLGDDLARGGRGNDAELGLRLGQRRLDVEPRLEARGLGEEGAHAGILDPE